MVRRGRRKEGRGEGRKRRKKKGKKMGWLERGRRRERRWVG